MARQEAERAALYIIKHLQQRFPGQWLGGGRSPKDGIPLHLPEIEFTANQQKRVMGISSLKELVENFSLRSVGRDSHFGLLGWLENRYPLILLDRIPDPAEMLAIQCEGRRFCTLLLGEEWQTRPIGRHHGACEFLLHDLEHAHKFFADDWLHAGQVNFFRRIRAARDNGFFDDYWKDPQFRSEFHYLISDMNSHPVHLLKFLKAIVLNANLRQTHLTTANLETYWRALFSSWEMSQNETLAALTINLPPHETLSTREVVAGFFVPSQFPALRGPFCQ